MVNQIVDITNSTGLHARPASEFIKLTSVMACDVYVEKDGRKVNAKSMLGLLSLAIVKGSKLNIITNGEGEVESLGKLVDFVNNLVD